MSPEQLRTIERDIAGAVILSADDKILMGQKNIDSGAAYSEGYWVIPGGGIDPGETPLQAMYREILEEVSLDVKVYPVTRLASIDRDRTPKTLPDGEKVLVHMQFFNFRVNIPLPAAQIPIQPSEELPMLEWVDIDAVAQYKLTPPSVELFTKLGYLRKPSQPSPSPKNKS